MKGSDDISRNYLSLLSEETRFRAWKSSSPELHRRITTGAVLFGKRLDETLSAGDPKLVYEQDVQRFLMRLMNDVVREFSRAEDISIEEATAFLGDTDNRDRILEFNEVIEIFESGGTGASLDELLSEAVKNRRDRALWADHWSSG